MSKTDVIPVEFPAHIDALVHGITLLRRRRTRPSARCSYHHTDTAASSPASLAGLALSAFTSGEFPQEACPEGRALGLQASGALLESHGHCLQQHQRGGTEAVVDGGCAESKDRDGRWTEAVRQIRRKIPSTTRAFGSCVLRSGGFARSSHIYSKPATTYLSDCVGDQKLPITL